MAQKSGRQSNKGVGVSLERLIENFAKGVTGLLGFAANLEAQGKDEYAEQGEIEGKTESGKEYRGVYGFRVKVGLDKMQNAKRQFKIKNGLN